MEGFKDYDIKFPELVYDVLDYFRAGNSIKEPKDKSVWDYCQNSRFNPMLRQSGPVQPATIYKICENFAYVNYNYKGRVRTPIFLLQVGKLGFFQYDVFDLIPTDSQQKELETLYEKGNGALYKWVTEDQIQTLGYADKTCAGTVDLINPHTKWAHNLKYSTH